MLFKLSSKYLEHSSKLSSLSKTQRSQSALEYMMTYGWAILIIVIVAVILYSMGIFNPSSSVTFTSSGFTPFTVSSSLCNNLGYKIAIIAGPIPDNANSLTISKVFLTSATGANTTTAAYTLTNPVTLKSGQTATILIPNVACSSAGIHYSLSASIQYSYSTTAGNVVENTTGTVAGTSIAGKPSVLISYEPLTITNTQNTATPSPFQQMVNFTSSDPGWTSMSTSNFGQNVEFFYYNGTVIPSWLENYTSTNAIWWLKIAAISGGSSETVYVGFAPTTINLFNTVNDGEAPQLTCPNPSDTASCSTYAEYDDGKNVFTQYDNYAGTTFSSVIWNPNSISSSEVVQNNGLTVYSDSSTSELTSLNTYSYSIVVTDIGFYNPVPPTNIFPSLGFANINGISSGGGKNILVWAAIGHSVIKSDPYLYNNVTNNLYLINNYLWVNVTSNGGFVAVSDNTPYTIHHLDLDNQGVIIPKDKVYIQYLAISPTTANFVMPAYTIGV